MNDKIENDPSQNNVSQSTPVYTTLMVAQEGSESTWESINNGKFISQF